MSLHLCHYFLLRLERLRSLRGRIRALSEQLFDNLVQLVEARVPELAVTPQSTPSRSSNRSGPSLQVRTRATFSVVTSNRRSRSEPRP